MLAASALAVAILAVGPPTVQAVQYLPSVIRVIAAGHLSWLACHGA
jgi:hypothetical protein